MTFSALRFCQNLFTDEKAQLNTHARKPNPLPPHFGGGSDIVVPSQFPSLHPGPIINHSEGSLLGSLVERRAGGQKRLPLGTSGDVSDARAVVTTLLTARAEFIIIRSILKFNIQPISCGASLAALLRQQCFPLGEFRFLQGLWLLRLVGPLPLAGPHMLIQPLFFFLGPRGEQSGHHGTPLSPGEKRGDKGVLLGRFHSEGCKGHGHG